MKAKNQPRQHPPEPPPFDQWEFVEDLKSPVRNFFNWRRNTPHADEADFSGGIGMQIVFPDPENLLETCYNDFKRFLHDAGIKDNGNYKIKFIKEKIGTFESYRIKIRRDSCFVAAGDTEGLRRGIFYLEDLLLSSDGPFLKFGTITRTPWIENRISRCFFGPIKRPPFNRDELMDDVDYYPDEYLNRLAHEGVNGLWLTVKFKELSRTSIIPSDPNAEQRLEKLRKTVKKCRRYGIDTYIFCIEPAAFAPDDPVLQLHPELKGVDDDNQIGFCPVSGIARKYLYEAVNSIFSSVPNLAGMINISLGERFTTCLSAGNKFSECPRCATKNPGELFSMTLTPMEQGMHAANPRAKLISWLYIPGNYTGKLYPWINELTEHVPEKVILQYNFESEGYKKQLDKKRYAGDYWLSYVGPSGVFKKIAENARENHTQMSAKLQVGCSHEVATVPFIPVPSLLYKKYKEMRKLGISTVMQCWYFGNYPGLMNKAAGELAFDPFPPKEDDFLYSLARPYWGEYSGKVVRAWKLFAAAYGNYPVNVLFQYYGPMHDGIVWPLHLFPANKVLSPTWKLDYPPSGDRIGECIHDSHTIEEVRVLCGRMAEKWKRGVKILKGIQEKLKHSPERIKDINLSEALGIQFAGGYNIIKFYSLRKKLAEEKTLTRLAVLDEMKAIVVKEIDLGKRLLDLCLRDSRLGFHSEAEGYKYFPEKLKWRILLLKRLLTKDFPAAEKIIQDGTPFPALPPGKCSPPKYICNSGKTAKCGGFEWSADYGGKSLIFNVKCIEERSGFYDEDFIHIYIEPEPMWPVINFHVGKKGFIRGFLGKWKKCKFKLTETNNNGWSFRIEIPLDIITSKLQNQFGINLVREVKRNKKVKRWSWINLNPLKPRATYSDYNPQDLGIIRLNPN
ncbi:MAG: hypothetical protein PHV82_03030 [Victivallaceae bacterium]|nr:hypothetical protein [Victivallaceae bacterium]